MTERITIEPTAIRGDRGQRYRVHYNGEVLIEDTWNPEFEAARALLARGITGRFETWRHGKSYACMRGDIEKAAKLTIVENATEGPRIANWAPLPENAFRARRGEPQTAENDFQVSHTAPDKTAALERTAA